MTENSGEDTLIDQASAGVQELAAAATAVLDQAGPAGAPAQPVVDALRNLNNYHRALHATVNRYTDAEADHTRALRGAEGQQA